jgi:nitroreductase
MLDPAESPPPEPGPAGSRFLELCRQRRSVRRFDDRPVERKRLEYCLEAARVAPSADNFQPWRFIVFDDPARRDALAGAVFRGMFAASRWAAKAPVLVVLLMKENLLVNKLGGGAAGNPFQHVDIGIAGEHFALACAEQGLGACWIGWFDARACVRHLGLRGRGYRAACLLAVGHPAPDIEPREPRRKPAEDVIFWNVPPR